MPAYVHDFEIDWGWGRLTETERSFARVAEARVLADPRSLTPSLLGDMLAAASRELPRRRVVARFEDDRGRSIVGFEDGRPVTGAPFDPRGRVPDAIGVDDFRAAGVERVSAPLWWSDELLRALQAQAVRLDCSMSWLVRRAWEIAKSDPPNGATAPDQGAKRKCTIDLPLETYAELASAAEAQDRSHSWVATRAIKRAWPSILALQPHA